MEKDYKNTLNLPKTDLPMKAGLPNKEPEILSFWDSINLYNLIREENAKKDKFILHDGPPYANGDIHLGHSVNKILKDIVIKTKTLQGFDAPYVPGWDCHGLPIELNVEKKFGRDSDTVKDKSKFISACREYALSQIENQKKDFIRLGVLGDWENSYKSLDSSFEADTVRSLGRIVTNGHLQKGEKPVHFCYDCKSALAEAEVEYEDKVSKSIDVGFKVKKDSLVKLSAAFSKEIDSCSFVIWTTTPWTIPANAAVSIGPELKYTLCTSKFGNLILASDLIDQCSERWDEDLEKISEAKGSDIKDVVLEHPYLKRDSILVHGDHVTTETGTGCVHTAPAHGVDDHNICKKCNIETIHALDGNGFFDTEYEGLAGLPAIKADNIVIDILNDSGALINAEDFHHSYPYCWRHKTPLIFASTPQWFISMEKSGLLEGSIQAVKDVEWEPSWGYERIKSMLEGRPDWCISRQRSWGVPIPLIINKKTGEIHPKQNLLFNEIADRIDEQGLEAWDKANLEDLIDDHDEYIKATDTLDVWFDSGSTHFCVLDKLYGKDLIAYIFRGKMLISKKTNLVAWAALHQPVRVVAIADAEIHASGRSVRAIAFILGVGAPVPAIQQIGASISGPLFTLLLAPSGDRSMIAAAQHIRNRHPPELSWTCVMRMLQQQITVAFLHQRCRRSDGAGQQAHHTVDDRHGRQLPAGEHKISQRHLLISQ